MSTLHQFQLFKLILFKEKFCVNVKVAAIIKIKTKFLIVFSNILDMNFQRSIAFVNS